MFRLATANLNGIRAAVRRGFDGWLAAGPAEAYCFQEVRAAADQAEALLPGLHVAQEVSVQKGRAGVAVATACEVVAVRTGLQGLPTRRDMLTGRWVEADVVFPGEAGPVTVVSAYVPTGELETDKQVAKYEFLGAMTARLGELMARAAEPGGPQAVVSGDFNVAHHEADIKNWKGNIGHRGFLEEERAYLTTWLEEQGWADVVRAAAGSGPGPYTWWSWRGKAFDNDAGWRIDYQLATPGLAARVAGFEIGRAGTYAARWSDHAPVIVAYA